MEWVAVNLIVWNLLPNSVVPILQLSRPAHILTPPRISDTPPPDHLRPSMITQLLLLARMEHSLHTGATTIVVTMDMGIPPMIT